MKKFHFQLAALLQIRESTRDQRRVELADAQRDDAELQNQGVLLDVERKELQGECRKAAGPGSVDLPRLVEAQRYAAALHDRKLQLLEQRRTLAVEIGRRRQVLIEADREVRMLDKLRENQFQTHRQEQERQETKQLDEAALQTTASGVI